METALETLANLRAGHMSARELMQLTYQRIAQHNGTLNALVNVLPEAEALALADEADGRIRAGETGALLGLPMAPKDLDDVAGFPTTFGFVPFAERVAARDGLVAERLRGAGAILIGKSNTPEFGLGSHTFNRLFGHTYNPYDPTKTPGGSSGGAAVALATGMLSVADGSDMGGSLRNPASFCNVVGFRPSVGRVPEREGGAWFGRIATKGPMARTVADTAHLLSVLAGPSADDPLSLDEPGQHFASVPAAAPEDLRIACPANFHNLPVEPAVARVIDKASNVFAEMGATVVDDAPDLTGAMDVFRVQRAANLSVTGRALDRSLPNWRDAAKDTMVWNIEQGMALSAEQVMASDVRRSALYRRAAKFFDAYDALLLPAAQVAPFSAKLDWIHEINGQPMADYLEWMSVACMISVTGLPAVSVPAGFTDDGLPVGLQIVGKPRGDRTLLAIAHLFEQATEYYKQQPSGRPDAN